MKKIWPILLITLFLGCDEEIDQEFISKIWNKTTEITEINPDTKIPQIYFLKKDYYNKLLNKNCPLYKGNKKTTCEKDMQEIDKQLKTETGKTSEELYKKYFDYERPLINKDCSDYDKTKERRCKKDKKDLKHNDSLGRAFLIDDRIEIYRANISKSLWDWNPYYEQNYDPIFFKQRLAFLYGTVAHEMLHIALFDKGIPCEDQHQIIKDSKYLEKLSDFISKNFDIPAEGAHKELLMKSLNFAIELDNKEKMARERLKI